MKFSAFTAVGVLAAGVAALPASVPHVVHEKRHGPAGWTVVEGIKPSRDMTIPLRIGLTQNNLDKGYDYLMDVADPTSPNYSKHWTAKQIADTFAPTQESVDAVFGWLVDSGVEPERVTLTAGRNWLTFNATLAEAESLLHTEYKFYEHQSGQGHVACEQYSVPKNIKHHIDLIMPTLQFDVKIVADPEQRRKRGLLNIGDPASSWLPKKGKDIDRIAANPQAPQAAASLATCNTQITPACLQALYQMPNGSLAKSSYAVVEYTPQAFLQSDLNTFYSQVWPRVPSGTAPTFDSIDGGVDQTTHKSFNYNGESDLDLQYAIALVYPQKTTLYQVGDLQEGASFNNFLDALDASYCTYLGGDNPTYDATYPDPLSGGYKSQDCGRYTPAAVISTSYGSNEADTPASYNSRQCNEYMKLGLAGVTILYSSGDNGVAGNSGQCCTQANCAGGTYNSGGSGTFNPSFPGGCPYVTSVGATQIVPGASVTAPEEACETVIYSGGGFSNQFAIPSYQSSAVQSYLTNYPPPYSSTQYHSGGQVRAFPDISANGANYVVAVDGRLSLVFGTSASSPTFGAVITLINEQRANVGKKPVGFINPTLYANPSALNDITSGGNQGCGTPGFTAVPGWDPVTGLGTPNYPKLLSVFMALP